MKNNGHDKIDIDELEEIAHRQNRPVITENDLESTFKIPEQPDAIKMLMTPSRDFLPLFMRSDVPSNRMVFAISVSYSECEDHGYESGKQLLEMLLAGMPARKGKRAELTSDTIIGEKHSSGRSAGAGPWNKFKNWAQGDGG